MNWPAKPTRFQWMSVIACDSGAQQVKKDDIKCMKFTDIKYFQLFKYFNYLGETLKFRFFSRNKTQIINYAIKLLIKKRSKLSFTNLTEPSYISICFATLFEY